jgi:hypothetical protein
VRLGTKPAVTREEAAAVNASVAIRKLRAASTADVGYILDNSWEGARRRLRRLAEWLMTEADVTHRWLLSQSYLQDLWKPPLTTR